VRNVRLSPEFIAIQDRHFQRCVEVGGDVPQPGGRLSIGSSNTQA
jgi:hypothetical protein